jgi:adenosylmethionine-8-amino-7-oxononanoate aminotransferase
MTRDEDLLRRDARAVWHPYTQHGVDPAPWAVRAAHGARLELTDGRSLVDAISSWWCCLHGHGRPEIAAAIADQARRLDHVLFAGCTHEPAVTLAERLLLLAPPGLARVFFSDNGSTAVEIALKMALQVHVHRGPPDRRVFVALSGAYHGDTFGAMAVGDPEPFFLPFVPLLFEVVRVPPDAAAVAQALDALGERAAGVVLEPLVQGAAGMQMHGVDFVRAVRGLCTTHELPLIADEVMTGFGRTGSTFACERAGITPDYLCLAKGLTGGTLPLSATLTTGAVFEQFLSADRRRTFFHGHTFTANPIACAAALASLDLLARERTPERLDGLGARIEAGLREGGQSVRRTGGIVAFDLPLPGEVGGYLQAQAPHWRAIALEHGVLLRPLGPVVYAMPPSCTSDVDADKIVRAMLAIAAAARA